MDMMNRCLLTFSKHIQRVALVLALILIWQVHQPALLGQFGSDVQYFSQVVLNDGSTTSFTINNPSTTETITVAAQLYLTDGQPLANGQVELGPGATETLDFGDPGVALTTGWAELKSDDEFIATEFFQLSIAGQLKPRVGVLPSVASDAVRFLGFVNPQFKSGLAVTNPSATEATEITIRARDNVGQEPVAAKILMLEPLQSVAGFLNEETFFGAALSNYEGVVEISVNSPGVAALSLIQELATGDVATVSVLTQSHIRTDENNTAIGVRALFSNTEGFSNTANGTGALESNTTGFLNTASGAGALQSNTTGNANTASGVGALGDNTTGGSNTASGVNALLFNTLGNSNTASGASALLSNTEGNSNTATGAKALEANTTGGRNTASGADALKSNTTGDNNTASGYRALISNTTGFNNTASGTDALASNTIGGFNTAGGAFALGDNTEGSSNTASGYSALISNTTGNNNTAGGALALRDNTTGFNNTASGGSALRDTTTGFINTASGFFALVSNTIGGANTASGNGALSDNTTGGSNTASGVALQFNTTGSDNIGVGHAAGTNLVTGNNNIYVGNEGAEESNTIRIGDADHTSAFIAGVQVVPASSRRFKQDIQDMDQAVTT